MVITGYKNSNVACVNKGTVQIHNTSEMVSCGTDTVNKIKYRFIEVGIVNQRLYIADFEQNSDANIIVLFVLTLLNNTFIYNEKDYELTFAYAVPLNKERYLCNFALSIFEKCIGNGQLVFLPADTLCIQKKISKEKYLKLCHFERKTISRNEKIIVKEVPFTDDFFEYWKNYELQRFGEIQEKSIRDFFMEVYSDLHFKLYKYSFNGETVAYNVCYYSDEQKVLYDVLFPWNDKMNVYRIGIFSILINVKRALDLKWGYSLCYGIFDYKTEILKRLEG